MLGRKENVPVLSEPKPDQGPTPAESLPDQLSRSFGNTGQADCQGCELHLVTHFSHLKSDIPIQAGPHIPSPDLFQKSGSEDSEGPREHAQNPKGRGDQRAYGEMEKILNGLNAGTQ